MDENSGIPHHREEISWRARLRCADWAMVLRVATSHTTATGTFFASTTPPPVGTRVEIELELPDGNLVSLGGECVLVRTPAEASAQNRRPGMGVRFTPTHRVDLLLLEEMARTAGATLPARPAEPARAPGAASAPGPASGVPSTVPPQPSAGSFASTSAPALRTIHGLSPLDVAALIGRPAVRAQPAVGIDFGTSFTRVAVFAGGRAELLTDDEGQAVAPSIVSWPDGGGCLVGWDARARVGVDPRRTVTSVKRLLGRRWDDPNIQGYLHDALLTTEKGPNEQLLVCVGDQKLGVPEICSLIIKRACEMAQRRLGVPVTRAVLSMPVTFGPAEQAGLKRAAQLAGVEVLGLIEEPMAAALAYDYGKSANEIIAVYDFGGGTFDFTVLDVTNEVFRVVATRGDGWLGGDDFDLAFGKWAADQFWRATKVELRQRAVEWQRLLVASEEAKRQLTATETAVISVPNACLAPQAYDLRLPVDRPLLEELCGPLVARSLEVCEEALDAAGLAPREVSRVVLAGGVTHVPLVQERVARFFERDIDTVVSPDAAVAEGTAIHAARLTGVEARTDG